MIRRATSVNRASGIDPILRPSRFVACACGTFAAFACVTSVFAQTQVAPAAQPAPAPGLAVQVPGVPMSPTVSVPVPGAAPLAAQPAAAATAPQPAAVAAPIPGIPGATVSVPAHGAPAAAAAGAKPAVQAVAAPPAQPAPPRPSVAELSFVIDPNVNPDASGRPSPVIVRIYELKSLSAFNRADFFALYERDREQLGPDLVNRDELPLMPGASPQAITTLRSDTRYLGVIAAFRDIERAHWRASTPILVHQTTRMQIKLDRNEVAIRLQ
jgi:type VI secretion system protein VasD